tara:strand:+ start:2355 stop:3317 length:963 start_codon:yes stop_codon:yes gene_type:complete
MILKESQLRTIITKVISEYYGRRGNYRFSGIGAEELLGRRRGSSELDGMTFTSDVPEGANHVYPVPKGFKIGSPPSEKRLDPVKKDKHKKHRGYDFKVPVGTPILSVAEGRVVETGVHPGFGMFVVISHTSAIVDDLSFTSYNHLSAKMVEKDDVVSAGQVIALSGNTGKSTGPHLHFSIGGSSKKGQMSFDKGQYDAFLASCKKVTVTVERKKDTSEDDYDRQILSKRIKQSGSDVSIDGVLFKKYKYSHSGKEETYLVNKDASIIRKRTTQGAPLSAETTEIVNASGIKDIFRKFLGVGSSTSGTAVIAQATGDGWDL